MTSTLGMNKHQRKAQAKREALDWMHQQWPNAFTDPPCPLAVGAHKIIHEAAAGAGFKASTIRLALRFWCNRYPYLAALARGGNRVNLDGTQGEPITAEQQAQAQARLDALKAARRKPRPKASAPAGKTEGRQKPVVRPRTTAPAPAAGKRPVLSLKVRREA